LPYAIYVEVSGLYYLVLLIVTTVSEMIMVLLMNILTKTLTT